jgi:CDP-diacylglycerol--glycerol-3-phosphate 3-phosphatidyltransferase
MIWTVPNVLTTLRLLAAPGVAVMFLYFNRPWADWLALTLFIGAAITDYFDGYLARLWKQESRIGAMLDPIADKAMVVIALLVITGYSGMNPWLILPATVIMFREVFVSGLREYLGDRAGLLQVTRLAKWKTTAQMVSIGILFLALGLDYVHQTNYQTLSEAAFDAHLDADAEMSQVWLAAIGAWYAGVVGLTLIWVAAALTLVTGWDYFRKSLPYLKDEVRR